MTTALTLPLVVAGCGTSSGLPPLSRDPGPAPVYLTEEKPPAPPASPVVDAANLVKVIERLNLRICGARHEWSDMRARMVAGKPMKAPAEQSVPSECVMLPPKRPNRKR